MPRTITAYSATSERYNAAHQCDWVDAHIEALHGRACRAQYDVLVRGSARGYGRMALAASQVPRCIAGGMRAGGTPAVAVRDVAVAVAAALFDDGMVLPLYRLARLIEGLWGASAAPQPRRRTAPGMRRAGPRPAPEVATPQGVSRPLQRLGDGLVLVCGLGGSLLAVPLNAGVMVATLLGAGCGAAAGLIAACLACVAAPRTLTQALTPGLGALVALTDGLHVIAETQAALVPNAVQRAQLEENLAIYEAAQPVLRACLRPLPRGRSVAQRAAAAHALERAMHQTPKLAFGLGMPVVPPGRVQELVRAICVHERRWQHAAQAFSDTDVFVDAVEYQSDAPLA